MVYFDDGVIKLTGGGSFTWTAPTEGPFAGLAAWAEKPGAYPSPVVAPSPWPGRSSPRTPTP